MRLGEWFFSFYFILLFFQICSLNDARADICAISLNNQLLAIAGHDEYNYSYTIEVYDEKNEKWVMKKRLPERGRVNAFLVPTSLVDKLIQIK